MDSLMLNKSKNSIYLDFLALACDINIRRFSQSDQRKFEYIFNQLPYYTDSLWRLLPILNQRAKDLRIINNLNSPVQELLASSTQSGIALELLKKKLLNRIVRELSENGVCVILLKGSAFSESLYSKEAPRLSNDIDIFVEEKNFNKSVKLLSQFLEYKNKSGGPFDELTQITFLSKGLHSIHLDLHFCISYPYLFENWYKGVWSRSEKAQVYNNELIRVLSPIDSIIHQAIHAFVDLDFKKYNLVDTNQLIKKNDLDVNNIIEASKHYGLDIIVFLLINNVLKVKGEPYLISKKNTPSSIRLWGCSIISAGSKRSFENTNYRYRISQGCLQYLLLKRPFACMKLQALFVVKNMSLVYRKFFLAPNQKNNH